MENKVKEIRESKKITQSTLAQLVGISRRSLVSIESGKTTPSIDVGLKLASALSTNVDMLFFTPTEDKGHSFPPILRFIDLFCGIGGFRFAAEEVFAKLGIDGQCVFSSDIDVPAQMSYEANFRERPVGDITQVKTDDIPTFDLLFGGFPCQTFSIIGKREGFSDKIRGTLFFEIARILEAKNPKAFVLENVKQLATHNHGQTLATILTTLRDDLGYYVDYRVLNALDYGLPQKRERIIIVGAKIPFRMKWTGTADRSKTLEEILEQNVDQKHFASPMIVAKRKSIHQSKYMPAIWHENKAGNISSYPYSCALRAGASYNYLLVNGERRLTPREMLRLQGFPESFQVVVSDCQIRKQVGNAIPVNLIASVLEEFVPLVFAK